jgi:hypothetical protein
MRDRAFTPVPWWDFVQVVLQVSVAVAGFLAAWLVWQRVRAYVGRQDAEQDALRIEALIKAMRSSGFDLDVPGGPATLMPAPGNTGSRWTSPCANCSHPVSIHDEAGVCTAKECIETARGQGITRWELLLPPGLVLSTVPPADVRAHPGRYPRVVLSTGLTCTQGGCSIRPCRAPRG